MEGSRLNAWFIVKLLPKLKLSSVIVMEKRIVPLSERTHVPSSRGTQKRLTRELLFSNGVFFSETLLKAMKAT